MTKFKNQKSFLSTFLCKWVAPLWMMALLLVAPTSAHATIGTTLLAVSVTVLAECLVATTPLLFGTYSVATATPTDATAAITAVCTFGTPYTIALDAGAGVGATMAVRKMTSAGKTLNYTLYTASNHTTVWGDGTSSTGTLGATAGLLPDVYTVHGRIPPTQQSQTGLYNDAVTVTLTY